VHALYGAFPPAFSLAALDPPEILTLGGVVDALRVEETQPFAARTIVRTQDGQELGVRLWLLGGNEDLNLWATDLEARSIVAFQAPANVAPSAFTDVLQAWRRGLPD
jgi:hypothetical protein